MGSGSGSGGSGGRDGEWLDLADAIALLREQVVEARVRIAGPEGDDGVRFGLGEITVELGMELTRTRGADGGLRFAVAGLGGRWERVEKGTHTVTVRLTPRSSDGKPVDVGDRA
ncbi:trypco2 family protein [Streptomyces sp. NPDC054834]